MERRQCAWCRRYLPARYKLEICEVCRRESLRRLKYMKKPKPEP